MNSFLLRRLLFCLSQAAFLLMAARAGAQSRAHWVEATCFHGGLMIRLRDRLHETAARAVKFARAAWLLLEVETLRQNYQMALFPL